MTLRTAVVAYEPTLASFPSGVRIRTVAPGKAAGHFVDVQRTCCYTLVEVGCETQDYTGPFAWHKQIARQSELGPGPGPEPEPLEPLVVCWWLQLAAVAEHRAQRIC